MILRDVGSASARAIWPERITLTTTTSGTGWCRRPQPGQTLGYAVESIRAPGALAGDLVTDSDLEDVEAAPWAVGDPVNVYPLGTPATRCGRCWACRGRRALEAVRRRNVTIAVVSMMAGPVLLFSLLRWWV